MNIVFRGIAAVENIPSDIAQRRKKKCTGKLETSLEIHAGNICDFSGMITSSGSLLNDDLYFPRSSIQNRPSKVVIEYRVMNGGPFPEDHFLKDIASQPKKK